MTSETAAMSRIPGFMQGLMLLLPTTMIVMGVSLLTTVVPLMYAHFAAVPNYAYLIQGGVITMPAVWVVLFSPVAGWLADQYGRRRLLITAMVLYSGVGVAPAFIGNLYGIIITRIGVGLCESVVMTVSTTMICDYFGGKSRDRWLAGQTATAALAALIIIPLGGVLASRFGWQGPFYVYLYSLLLVCGVLIYIWEPPSPDGTKAIVAADTAFSASFPWPRMLGLCAVTVVAAVMFYSIVTQNGNALAILGVHDPARQGLLTMIASLGVPCGTFAYWLAARLRNGWLLAIEFALMSVGFWGMGHATKPSGYVMYAFFNQFGCGLVLPTMLIWTTRDLAYSVRGRGNGMWQASFAMGQFGSGMVIQFIGDKVEGLLPAFSVLSVACVGVTVVSMLGTLYSGPHSTGQKDTGSGRS